MTNWDDYSIYDLVTLTDKGQFKQYISMIRTVFTQLEGIYEIKIKNDKEALEEHTIVLSYLRRLFYTFELLYTKYLYSPDNIKVDFSDSGFVNFFEISQLETDMQTKINQFALQNE